MSCFQDKLIFAFFLLIGHLYLSGYVVRCNSKNEFQKDMCSKEIVSLRTQNVLTVLGSIVNKIWRNLYDHFNENLHFDNG